MSKRPNLLIIQTDQQSTWTLSALGSTLVNTPNIDFIGQQGAIFENYTVSALCTPSRGSFLTGRYPCMNGAYKNDAPLNIDEITLAHILQNEGYETGYAGKWHLAGTARPGWMKVEDSMGFKDCRWMFNRGHWKSIIETDSEEPEISTEIGDEKTYTTDWLTTKTIEFIQTNAGQPFFHMLSIPDPHTPFSVREPYASMFETEAMPIPVTYNSEAPEWPFLIDEAAKKEYPKNDAEALKKEKTQYLGEVKCIDDNIGRIIKCLSDEGILDETIIVFTSDHGEYFGEHGLWGKNKIYESVYHIPFFIYFPEKISKGTVIKEFVTTVDFQRTILSLMNVNPCGREYGRDASFTLTGNRENWEDVVYLHHNFNKYVSIVTPEYQLAFVKDGENVLFDRRNDVEQINNLFYEAQYAEVVRKLWDKMLVHYKDVGSPAASWLTHAL